MCLTIVIIPFVQYNKTVVWLYPSYKCFELILFWYIWGTSYCFVINEFAYFPLVLGKFDGYKPFGTPCSCWIRDWICLHHWSKQSWTSSDRACDPSSPESNTIDNVCKLFSLSVKYVWPGFMKVSWYMYLPGVIMYYTGFANHRVYSFILLIYVLWEVCRQYSFWRFAFNFKSLFKFDLYI